MPLDGIVALMITSPYPSPFTSPAVATVAPNSSPADIPFRVVEAEVDKPPAVPKNISAVPGLPVLSPDGAPTITSLKPSPFTSPALETLMPKSNTLASVKVTFAAALFAIPFLLP